MVLQHVTASTLFPVASLLLRLLRTQALHQTVTLLSFTRPTFWVSPWLKSGTSKPFHQVGSRSTEGPSRACRLYIALGELKLPKTSHKVQLEQSMRGSVWAEKASPWCWTLTWMSSSWTPDCCISQVLVPNMELQLTQVFHHFWESHWWPHRICHRAFEIWSDFWKKADNICPWSTQSRQQRHTAQASTQ